MEQLNGMLAVAGLVVVTLALVSEPLKKSILQLPLLAVLVGVAVGPHGAGWLRIEEWGEPTPTLEQASRITLAIGLMGVALRLDRKSFRTLLKPVGLILLVGMLGMWAVSSALSAWLLSLPFWTALLLGAVLTPTDPVVASSIVTGPFAKKRLPLHLRDSISFESGANDGLAYLFVMLAVLMIGHPPEEAWSRWAVESLLVGVVAGAAAGAVIGFVAAKLLTLAHERDIIENSSLLSYTVAFSLMTLGATALFNADALIAVFAAGLAFNLAADRGDEQQEEDIQEAVAKLFTLPMFIIFGIALPIMEWLRLGWPLLALAMLILLLRRPPVILLLSPTLRPFLNLHDSAFTGWFGPIGIAAIYYAAFARGHVHDPLIWHAGSAVIFASILLHGITAAPFTRLHSRHPGPSPRAAEPLDSDGST